MIKKNLYCVSLLLAFIIIGASSLHTFAQAKKKLAQKLSSDSSIFTMVVAPDAKLETGKTFDVKIKIRPNKDWHLYSAKMSPDVGPVPITFSIPPELSKIYSIVGVKENAKPVSKLDENFGGETKSIYGAFEEIVKVKVLQNAPLGKTPLKLYIEYTTCSESLCLPPRTFEIPMNFLGQKDVFVNVLEGKPDSADIASNDTSRSGLQPDQMNGVKTRSTNDDAGVVATVDGEKDLLKVAKQSIWQFILLTIGFGLLALLTPCVFPMIPITVSFFTKRNSASRKDVVLDATYYALGIITTFVGLGFLLSALIGSTGINKVASSPIANFIIAFIFITFALNLFGLFELGIPSSVLTKLNIKATTTKNKRLSVILMGFVFSLTSFTCTVPIVGTLMVAFQRGEWFVPLVGMTVFATVFALPFFLLALFPSAMKSLPKSGGWLNSVKVVMGFLELAAALKFISNIDLVWHWGIFTRDLIIASWAAIFLITALYLLGRFQLPHDTPSSHIGPIRTLFALFFLTAGIYMFTGFHGKPLGELDGLLPPAITSEQASLLPTTNTAPTKLVGNEELYWHPRLASALVEAKKSGKNIFIDFTGYTCTNCRAMESQVFSRKDVQDLFKDFVLARLYTDDGSPLNDSNQHIEESRFNTIALPYYAIVSPNDVPLGTFPGYTRDYISFVNFLIKHKEGGNAVASRSGF